MLSEAAPLHTSEERMTPSNISTIAAPMQTKMEAATTPPTVGVGKRRTTVKKMRVRSSKSNVPGVSRYWTPSEHKLFIEAVLHYGPKDLKAIARCVGTRSVVQCRTHSQKFFQRLMREAEKETAARRWIEDGANDARAPTPYFGIALLSVCSEEMRRALDG